MRVHRLTTRLLRATKMSVAKRIMRSEPVGPWAYWREHLNRFGVFSLDMDKNEAEIEYTLESG